MRPAENTSESKQPFMNYLKGKSKPANVTVDDAKKFIEHVFDKSNSNFENPEYKCKILRILKKYPQYVVNVFDYVINYPQSLCLLIQNSHDFFNIAPLFEKKVNKLIDLILDQDIYKKIFTKYGDIRCALDSLPISDDKRIRLIGKVITTPEVFNYCIQSLEQFKDFVKTLPELRKIASVFPRHADVLQKGTVKQAYQALERKKNHLQIATTAIILTQGSSQIDCGLCIINKDVLALITSFLSNSQAHQKEQANSIACKAIECVYKIKGFEGEQKTSTRNQSTKPGALGPT